MIRLVCLLTSGVVWMDGTEYSFFGESGSAGTVTPPWVGRRLDLRLSTSFYNFNEDGAMLLMRRTGWARTNISHENGWNDIAWLYGRLIRYTYIYFHVKSSLYTKFLKFQ
jgi:hypothetical protein